MMRGQTMVQSCNDDPYPVVDDPAPNTMYKFNKNLQFRVRVKEVHKLRMWYIYFIGSSRPSFYSWVGSLPGAILRATQQGTYLYSLFLKKTQCAEMLQLPEAYSTDDIDAA